jgi:hypothetical protein
VETGKADGMMRLLRPFCVPVLTALLLTAVFVRGVLPVGFMPVAYSLVICTETGAKSIAVLADETKAPGGHKKQQAPCVFSVSDTPIFSLFTTGVKNVSIWEKKPDLLFAYALFTLNTPYRLPFAQGPPDFL